MQITTTSPLEWPAQQQRAAQRVASRFGKRRDGWGNDKLSIAEARRELLDELERLGAGDIVLSSNLLTRNDGLPRSGQREPDDSGVAVYFTLRGTRSVIAIDRYNRVADNLYAVARTIEALRQIDRDGGPSILRAATSGFRALPGPQAPWWGVLGVSAVAGEAEIKTTFRALAKKRHPDVGGTPQEWSELHGAYERALQDAQQAGRS